METRVTLKPGNKGTKKLVTQFGERLVCVRYRYDAVAQVRYKTVELVIEQLPWNPAQRARRQGAGPRRPPVLVGLRVHFHEEQLRRRVKDAGGRWLPQEKLWVVPIGVARRLGLAHRAGLRRTCPPSRRPARVTTQAVNAGINRHRHRLCRQQLVHTRISLRCVCRGLS